jgi:flavodoxin
MKKAISSLLIIMMLACVLAGCSGNTYENSENSTPTETAQNTESITEENTDSNNTTDGSQTQTENGSDRSEVSRTLVVYYSASGNTKAVAETIAESANADIFEIVPTEIYSDADLNWRDRESRVSKEYADESLRDVELVGTTAPNWDEYDTVFIGYPIWWGIAAWPVNAFVEANSFSEKTVIPFCTSTSSGFGQSGELLAELADTGDWQEGMRFRSGASSEDVDSWTKEVLGN